MPAGRPTRNYDGSRNAVLGAVRVAFPSLYRAAIVDFRAFYPNQRLHANTGMLEAAAALRIDPTMLARFVAVHVLRAVLRCLILNDIKLPTDGRSVETHPTPFS
jgi:hypothetical protein